MIRREIIAVLVLAPVLTAGAMAQEGVVTSGAPDVIVGGQPAARAGDQNSSGDVITHGSDNVFINGRPAATLGSGTGCGGLVVGGAASVIVGGKPLARAGDPTAGCPTQ